MEQKTVHLDKAAESVKNHEKVENYYWEDGDIVVQFENDADIYQLITELSNWGLKVKSVFFQMNIIRFKQVK